MMPTFFTSPTNYFVLSYHMYANQFCLPYWLLWPINSFVSEPSFPSDLSSLVVHLKRNRTRAAKRVQTFVAKFTPRFVDYLIPISIMVVQWSLQQVRSEEEDVSESRRFRQSTIYHLNQQLRMTTLTTTKCSNCSSYSAPHSLTATASNQHVGCLTISAIINTCWRYAVIAGKYAVIAGQYAVIAGIYWKYNAHWSPSDEYNAHRSPSDEYNANWSPSDKYDTNWSPSNECHAPRISDVKYHAPRTTAVKYHAPWTTAVDYISSRTSLHPSDQVYTQPQRIESTPSGSSLRPADQVYVYKSGHYTATFIYVNQTCTVIPYWLCRRKSYLYCHSI